MPSQAPVGIRWSDHVSKLLVTPPFVASIVSTGLLVAGGSVGQSNAGVETALTVAILIINPLLAIAASMAAGLLVRGTVGDKLYAAVGGALFAFFAYGLTTAGLCALVGMVVWWISST